MEDISRKKIGYVIYNNISSPYLRFVGFHGLKKMDDEKLDFTSMDLVDGLPSNFIDINNMLKKYLSKYEYIKVLLNVNELVRSSHEFPKMNGSKELKLFQAEQKDRFPDFKTKYKLTTYTYTTSVEKFFYCYYMPIQFSSFASKIVREAKGILRETTSLEEFIVEYQRKRFKNDFIYVYSYNDVTTLAISLGNAVVTGVSFESNLDLLNRYLYCYGDRHHYEYEKAFMRLMSNNDEYCTQLENCKKVIFFD